MYFVYRRLRKALNAPLRSILAGQFGRLKKHFRATVSATFDELVDALKSQYSNTGVSTHRAAGKIHPQGAQEAAGDLTVYVFPIEALEHSTHIKDALAPKLAANVRLDAARNAAGISTPDWNIICDKYAAEVVKHGLKTAFKQMVANNDELYFDDVLDVAEDEPLRVGTPPVAGYHTVIVLYKPAAIAGVKTKKARKIWNKRTSGKYTCALHAYDGYTAP
jgi:archaeosine-15-forming tRNA-guanine transglycosylase